MAYISYFIYSESTQNENVANGSKLHIVQPMHIIIPMFIPSLFSFSVSFGVLDIKQDESHRLRYTFKSPDNVQAILIDTGDINIPSEYSTRELPDDMNGLMLNLDFRNIPFKTEGEYIGNICR